MTSESPGTIAVNDTAPEGNNIPVSTPPPPKKNFPIILIIIFIIVAVLIAGLSYFLGANGFKLSEGKKPSDSLSTITPIPSTAIILPTGPLEKNPTSSPSGVPTKKVTATLPEIPGSIVYTSEALGLRFRHAQMMEKNDPSSLVRTKEIGNKVYVYTGIAKPESGQYVEVFTKVKTDSLEEAVRKQFLKGIDAADCYVSIQTDKKLPANFIKAIIAYPVPTDSDQPAFTMGDKCPSPYSAKGGISYFLSDKNYPEKLLFFSIGQYAIDSQTGNLDSFWQDTIEILK